MQKTIITVICIAAILLSLTVLENNIVDKYCDRLYRDAKNLKKDLENNGDAASEVQKIIDKWEKNKDKVYVFVNHNSFNDIENALYNTKYYIKNNKHDKALFQSEYLLQRVIELRGSFDFSLGNLL